MPFDMSQPFDRSRDLAEATRKTLTTLRIIVAALAVSPIVFAAVAIGQNTGQPHTLAGPLNPFNTALLGFGLIAVVLGAVFPRIVFASSRGAAPTSIPPGLSPEQRRFVTPELVRIDSILQRLQTSTIIGCALFEGGAFANIVGYMQTRECVHLVLASVLVLGVLSLFPTKGSFERRIEDELRRMQDAESLEKSP